MRRLAPWLLALSLLGTVGSKLDRLDEAERDHYFALRVYMSDADQKAYLKLKTREDRDAWLKGKGLWERFYKYDDAKREAIATGDVKVGFTEDMVFMAWGNPFVKKRLTGRDAARSELLVYRFETTPDGATMVWQPKSKATYKAVAKFQLDVYVDDSRVTAIERKDGWE